MTDLALINTKKGTTVIDGTSELDFEEFSTSVSHIKDIITHDDFEHIGSDLVTVLDKLQGNALIQGKAQYLVLKIEP